MKKVIIYCRVSTEEQAKSGISLDAQEHTCRKAAETAGYSTIEVIRDEGKSAGSLDRPGIQKIIKLCKENKVERIFSLHSDRLARNVEDHIALRKLFKENGVSITYALQPGMDNNTAFGQTMDTMTAAFNEMQRLVVKEKTKGALLEKVGEGWFPGVAPLGYKNVDNPNFRKGEISRRIIVPDPETAPFVKEMFELYATGNYSLEALAELMAKKGLRTRRGKMIHHHKLPETLRNRLYIGKLNWGGVRIEKAKHQPIIGKNLFERVQRVTVRRNKGAERKRKYKFLLRGIVHCAKCGRRLCAEWHTKPSGLRFGYYHCPNNCSETYVQVSDLEIQISERFKTLNFNEPFVEMVINKSKAILADKSGKISSRKKGLLNQKTALEQKRDTAEEKLFKGVIGDEDFTRIRQTIKEGLEAIETGISELENTREIHVDVFQELILLARNIHQAFTKAGDDLKRRYINLFWQKFELKDRKISLAEPSKLFKTLLKANRGIISLQMGGQRDSNPFREFHRFSCEPLHHGHHN